MQFVYVPIGVPTFDLEIAGEQFRLSCNLMKDLFADEDVCPDRMLLSIDDLRAFLDSVQPDLIVLQNITFANAAYCEAVISAFPEVPVLLWTLREPVIDGKRLRLNSLTGAYSAANKMAGSGKGNFGYIFGSPEDGIVRRAIIANAKAVSALKEMRGSTVAAICVNGALMGMNYKYEKGAVQTLENLKSMYNLATLIPAVMFGIMSILLLWAYPLSKQHVADLQVEKEQKLKEHYESKKIDI